METNIITVTEGLNSSEVSQTEKMVLFNYLDFFRQGKKLCLLSANRSINDKNVAEKVKSIKDNGVINPLVIVDAIKVSDQGFELVDFETGDLIPKEGLKPYYAVIDGQHRLTAYFQLLGKKETFDKTLYLLETDVTNKNVIKILSEMNNVTRKWDGKDNGRMADVATKGEFPLLKEIRKQTDKGFSLDSAVKWLTFKSEVTSSVLTAVSSAYTSGIELTPKMIEKVTNTAGIERGLNILKSAKTHIDLDALKSRSVIDWIISKYDSTNDQEKGTFETDMCNFFEGLTDEQGEKISKAKGIRGVQTKETIILNLLNQYYKEFQKEKQMKEVA